MGFQLPTSTGDAKSHVSLRQNRKNNDTECQLLPAWLKSDWFLQQGGRWDQLPNLSTEVTRDLWNKL